MSLFLIRFISVGISEVLLSTPASLVAFAELNCCVGFALFATVATFFTSVGTILLANVLAAVP
jgi:hypothetical protein